MAKGAIEAMTTPGMLGVVMTVEKGKMPKTFPKGELLNEMKRQGVIQRTYSFPPKNVLDWLVKNRLLEVEESGGRLVIREVSGD